MANTLAGHKKPRARDIRTIENARQKRHRYDDKTAFAAQQCGLDYVKVHIPACELVLNAFTGMSHQHPDLDRWRRDKTPDSFELTLPAMDYGKKLGG